MPTTYAIPNGRTVMDATLYTGNNSVRSITNSDLGSTGFKPDLVWVKDRNAAYSNCLVDSVRGVGLDLYSDLTQAQTSNPNGVTAFNSNGFSVGTANNVNVSSDNFVAWQWQAGQGSSSSNTNGSITSTVSVNTTAGFSVVTYTGTGSAATVGHGLGVTPSMIIIKSRSTAGTDWPVYHSSLGATGIVALDSTIAFTTISTPWNNTAPTSAVFTVGTSGDTNGSTRTYVAYCWAQVAGFSQFGSYTGNGSTDGPFIYTGFRPKFVLRKRTDTTSYWVIMDSTRNTYNLVDLALYPNDSLAESSDNGFDFLSNGFKIRSAGSNINASGGTYIYAAFAENPFKYANAR